jgi:RNA polymerase sigma-32 factor
MAKPKKRKQKESEVRSIDDVEILPADSSEEKLTNPTKKEDGPAEAIETNSQTPKNSEMLPVIGSSELALPGTKDPLAHYLQEISKYELLSIEQERELTKALVETGDIEIAKKLVKANLRLVVKIAMEYRHAYKNILDLIQEGNIGLMKAVSKYDPDKGAKLSYYASWWIKSYILKFILDNFRLVKIGTTTEQKKLFYNLMKEKSRLEAQGIQPNRKLLSENLGVSEKALTIMEQRLSPEGGEVSLDTPLDDGAGSSTLGDMLATDAPSAEERLADAQELEILKKNLHKFMQGLGERDLEIFKKRLLSEVKPSLQSIADDYGVTRERVRQIEERLKGKLKEYMHDFFT